MPLFLDFCQRWEWFQAAILYEIKKMCCRFFVLIGSFQFLVVFVVFLYVCFYLFFLFF